MFRLGSQKNPNKQRQVVGQHRAARTSSRSTKKGGGGFVSIASTMTNLVPLLLALMLLALSSFLATSSLAESTTNDALEIGDTHAILGQSKVSSLLRFLLEEGYHRDYYDTTVPWQQR
jgi:hypothetical protein